MFNRKNVVNSEQAGATTEAQLEKRIMFAEAEVVEANAKVVEANKETAKTYCHLGALIFLRDSRLALDHYLKAAELDPTNPDIWRTVARLYDFFGEAEKASDATRNVTKLEKMAR